MEREGSGTYFSETSRTTVSYSSSSISFFDFAFPSPSPPPFLAPRDCFPLLMPGIRPFPPAPDLFVLMLSRICRILSCDGSGRGFHFLRIVDWEMFLVWGARVGWAVEEGFKAPIFTDLILGERAYQCVNCW